MTSFNDIQDNMHKTDEFQQFELAGFYAEHCLFPSIEKDKNVYSNN